MPAGRARKENPLQLIQAGVMVCRRCPRLVAYREQVAREKVRRYRAEAYWGKPIPGFGDPQARFLVVGLAPAAHGGNRTGRLLTHAGQLWPRVSAAAEHLAGLIPARQRLALLAQGLSAD